MINQEIKDRMIRARIQMQKKSPFFAWLVMKLDIIEKEEVPTMAVDNYNHLYYNPDWVKPLSDNQIEGILTHEVCHIVFEHLVRNQTRDSLLFNCACDIVINDLLISNNFQLVDSGIIPSNHAVDFCGVHISDIDKKSAENVYDELYSKFKKTQANMKMAAAMQLDEHIQDDIKKLENGTKEEQAKAKDIKDNLKKWKELAVEAASYSRMIGKNPSGVDRMIGELLENKVNWKTRLYKYVTNSIAQDFSYSRPSRRGIASGIYLPHTKKENLEVVVAIDVSGSIQQAELTEFVSEIVYLAKSFANLKIKVIICDCAVQGEVVEVDNGNVQRILDLKIKGGGGTSVAPVAELIDNEYPTTHILIYFTDGFIDNYNFNSKMYKILWLISKGGRVETCESNGGEVIKLE